MDLQSLKELLRSLNMEEVPYSSDVFNIYCRKCDEPISTAIQFINDPTTSAPGISSEALRLFHRATEEHASQHEPEYQVSLFEDGGEAFVKTNR